MNILERKKEKDSMQTTALPTKCSQSLKVKRQQIKKRNFCPKIPKHMFFSLHFILENLNKTYLDSDVSFNYKDK